MKEYEKMEYGENLSWCMPYLSESTNSAIVLHDEDVSGLMIHGEVCEATPETIGRLARVLVGNDYENQRKEGYDDLEIVIEAMNEVGCARCPWRDECDVMGRECETTDE